MAKPDIVKKLPEILQTDTERKFFEATFDQVFSKKNSEKLTGYIGRREGGQYDPINDFYLPEPTRNRTWWQLEPVSFGVNPDTLEKENQMFYEDLVDRIDFLGGETGNHDRLFNSDYYSYAPPINIDMFINYQNYFWLPDGIPVIEIENMIDTDIEVYILQEPFFNTDTPNRGVTPANLDFSSGMRVRFIGTSYTGIYTVGDVGSDTNIKLIEDTDDVLSVKSYDFLPWDSKIDLSIEIVDNSKWDNAAWDAQEADQEADYITMQRGSADHNAWSRTNKWYHVDLINEVLQLQGQSWPDNAQRAKRPIIEFIKDLELFRSGINYFSDVNFMVDSPKTIDEETGEVTSYYGFVDVEGQSYNAVAAIPDLATVKSGDLIVFKEDQEYTHQVWSVAVTDNTVWLTAIESEYQERVDTEDNDIIIIVSGSFPIESSPNDPAHKGLTYYKSNNEWVLATNQKVKSNQPILFNLYDHDKITLSDNTKYPSSTFNGSKIFSYKVDDDINAVPDPVLGFPIVYKDLGQISDIVFENDLITDRYDYISGNEYVEIPGYYYYHNLAITKYNNDTYTNQDDVKIAHFNSWYKADHHNRQRVIDRFVATYNGQSQYILSVRPVNGANSSMRVLLNGELLTTDQYMYTTVNEFDVIEILDPIKSGIEVEDVLETYTYTNDDLADDAKGYWQIAPQLELNPDHAEIGEYSIGEFTPHFVSIIENQDGFTGTALGQGNNYRDSNRDLSRGEKMIHTESSLLKTMFVSSAEEVDVISALRYARQEYLNFKSKFLTVGKQLIDRTYSPIMGADEISIDIWVEEILRVITVSREFSDAFAYSYMMASGSVFDSYFRELFDDNDDGEIDFILITTDVDPTIKTNFMYIYNVGDDKEDMLLVDEDYTFVFDEQGVNITFNINSPNVNVGDQVIVRIYENPSPVYLPSTPAKMGMSYIARPGVVLDTSYIEPTWVILGHDGSKTVTFGTYADDGTPILSDFRDNLLLEFERRIYNGIISKYRDDYALPLRLVDIREGAYRQAPSPGNEETIVRYSYEEFHDITLPHFTKWCAYSNANARVNSHYDGSSEEEWKTWNYSSQVGLRGEQLPGHWRGVYKFYFDTDTPNITPWEMLGFAIMPDWWVGHYNPPTNPDGSYNWGYDPDGQSSMWEDIMRGRISYGNRAGIDERFARPDLLYSALPVDIDGNLIPAPTLFGLTPTFTADSETGEVEADNLVWEGANDTWVYGDGAPVEKAWHSSSEYFFSVMEFFYVMRPSEFGELFWNTGITGKEMTDQFVDTTTHSRIRNADQEVHAELIDTRRVVNDGYQQYISDRLLFLGRDVTPEFGDKIRTLSANLGYKMAGFTNKESLRLSLVGSNVSTDSDSLLIPSNNYEVYLYKGSSIEDYTYSGVIVRALPNGEFSVHGYDLFSQDFKIIPRLPTGIATQVKQGGTPAEYRNFNFGDQYLVGEIVYYHTRFYQAIVNHVADTFDSDNWLALGSLPEVGGISVSYVKEGQDGVVEHVPYGTVFENSQQVFDFLISYSDFLVSRGWKFEQINSGNNIIDNWFNSAKQFLFWASNDWQANNALFLSPGSLAPTLDVERGYPDSVEQLSNGVYSILDIQGTSIHPRDTVINRKDQFIQVKPKNNTEGVYFLKVSATETEHIVLIDNTTSFNDIVYDPVLGVRQTRLKWNGVKTGNWFGKLEAEGYLVKDNELIQNYDNIVESFRSYYNTEDFLDNVQLEEAAKHLIGYSNRDYLDNLDISDDVQFNFYQGFVREKGTMNAVSKLLRSDIVSGEQAGTEFFEEWAFKLGEFGGIAETVNLEFLVNFDEVKSNPQAARMNFVTSTIGSVASVEVFNAIELYNATPLIEIEGPDYTVEGAEQATAVAVLGPDSRILEILLTNPGAGYHHAPYVNIIRVNLPGATPVPTPDPNDPEANDKLYTVFQPDIVRDDPLDDVIEIDIDDSEKFLLRPEADEMPFIVPKTDDIVYTMPNSGYVHSDDVQWEIFNRDAMFDLWESGEPVPTNDDLIHLAINCQEDWGVYKSTDIGAMSDLRKGLLSYPGSALVDINAGAFNGANPMIRNRHHLCCNFSLKGTNSAGFVRIRTDEFDQLFNYVYIGDILLENIDIDETSIYQLLDRDRKPIVYDDVFGELDMSSASYEYFINHRFKTQNERDSFGPFTTLTWVDAGTTAFVPRDFTFRYGVQVSNEKVDFTWQVQTPSDEVWRRQEDLIQSELYVNAYLRERYTGETISRLPVYDPFKDLIPGVAAQNITYQVYNDPARYTNSSNPLLIDTNNEFDSGQVGEIWLDLSSFRYKYYEQSINRVETTTEIMDYRRNNWGKMFPGSVVDVYEWVVSDNLPSKWDLDGTPKNTTDYVKEETVDTFTGNSITKYYFWVNLRTTKPNKANRTLTGAGIRNVMMNPRAQGYEWFASIQGTSETNTVILGNVDHIIANRNTVVQLNYKTRVDANEEHTQWTLLSEGNRFSEIPDYLWDKMVNSLVGYTTSLPVGDYQFAITADGLEGVLPIPAPNMAEDEKYGIRIRPQQSMFVDKQNARQIFVQASNKSLSEIKLWITNPTWSDVMTSDTYWEQVDWYREGYSDSNTRTSTQVLNLQELEDLKPRMNDGDLTKVYDPAHDDAYEIYEYVAVDNNFILVKRQNGTIAFKDTLYTENNRSSLRRELRELCNALKEEIFTGTELVNTNLLFFSMVNFVFSEQSVVDWVFKTTYINMIQDGIELKQNATYSADVSDEFTKYVEEAKPYHTKVREKVKTYRIPIEFGVGEAYDDAIGDFISECVTPDTSLEECSPNRVSWHYDYGTWNEELGIWEGNTITENLRYMKVKIEFNRHYCTEEQQDYVWETKSDAFKLLAKGDKNRVGRVDETCHDGAVIDGGSYSTGWDSVPWDSSSSLPVIDAIGTEIDIELSPFKWDSTEIENSIDSEGYINQSEDPDADLIEAGRFLTPGEVPEEVIPLHVSESVVITNTMPGMASTANGTPTDIAFRLHLSPMGWTEAIRISDNYSTELVEPVTITSTTISISDSKKIQPATKANPGVVWIDAERITYTHNKDGVLSGLTRGTMGTAIAEHAITYTGQVSGGGIDTFGTMVYEGGKVQYIPIPDNAEVATDGSQPMYTLPDGEITPLFDPWFEYVDGILVDKKPQGDMLVSQPGSFRPPNYVSK